MDEITVDKSVYCCFNNISHEGKALMEGAARSGFFIELSKDGKAQKFYRCNRWSGWGNYQTNPRDHQHLKRTRFRHETRARFL